MVSRNRFKHFLYKQDCSKFSAEVVQFGYIYKIQLQCYHSFYCCGTVCTVTMHLRSDLHCELSLYCNGGFFDLRKPSYNIAHLEI